MPPPLVAVSDSVFPNLEPARAVLSKVGAELRLARESKPEAILEVAREADALLTTSAKIPGEIIRQMTQCRIIARFGIGVDNVDIQLSGDQVASGLAIAWHSEGRPTILTLARLGL